MLSPNNRYHGSEDAYFRMAEHSLEKALHENRMTENDVKLIKKYTLKLKPTLSPGRYAKLTFLLVNTRKYFGVEYAEVDEDEYLEALSRIKYAKHEAGRNKGQDYSANTKTDWLKINKRFFAYLQSKGLTKVPVDVINSTQTGGYDYFTKTEEDVLTADEINRIIAAAKIPKYKAYFGLLYETGARSIELANLRWQDLTFNEWGISCNLRDAKAGKTPKVRNIPCVMYAKYVADWRAQYPGNPTGENFVFTVNGNTPIQYNAVRKALSKYVKEAGITRAVSLHRFRHSRITHCLREGMSETLVKKAFWGNQSTAMISTYGHLTNNDVEDEYLRMAGVDVKKKANDEAPKPIQCQTCHTVNPPGMRFCGVCGKALTEDAEKDVADEMKTLEDVFGKMSDAKKYQVLLRMNELAKVV